MYHPALQGVQAEEPAALVIVPAGHGTQSDSANAQALAENFPAMHLAHTFPSRYLPELHMTG